jgi:hypothetical protein
MRMPSSGRSLLLAKYSRDGTATPNELNEFPAKPLFSYNLQKNVSNEIPRQL